MTYLASNKPITLPELGRMKHDGQKIAMLTGYDASFAALEGLQPARIVPGHGEVCDLPKAQTQTRDYLQALRTHMKKAVDDGSDIGAAIKAFDAKPWLGLFNAADLHPGNASRTYLELERE